MFRSISNSELRLPFRIVTLFAVTLLLAVPGIALAQDVDPPSRVARLNPEGPADLVLDKGIPAKKLEAPAA